MRLYYGEQMPLRILDETEFWKRQEAEHTVVIREAVVGLETKYVKLLEQWEQVFSQTEAIAVKYIERIIRSKHRISPELQHEIKKFIQYSIDQSKQFVALLNEMAEESKAVRTNPVAGIILSHIRRESKYYVGIAQAFLNGNYVN